MGLFQDLKLKHKLWIFSFFFLITLVGATGTSIYLTGTLSDDTRDLATVELPSVHKMTLVDMMHDGLRAVVFSAYFAKIEKKEDQLKTAGEEVEEFGQNINSYFNELAALPIKPEVKKNILESKMDVMKYADLAKILVNLIQQNDLPGFRKKLPEFQEQFSILEEKLEVIGGEIIANAEMIQSKSVKKADFVAMLLMAACIFVVLFSLVFSFLFINNIHNRFTPLVKLIQSIQDGVYNLSFMDPWKDEISFLGKSIIGLAKTIEEQISHIKKALDESENNNRQAEEAKKAAEQAMIQAAAEKGKAVEALKVAESAKINAQEAQKNAAEEEKKAVALLKSQEEASLTLQKKVDQILHVVDQASSGNFTSRIHVIGDDPIDQLSMHLNEFFQKMNTSLSEVDSVSNQLFGLSNKMLTLNQEISSSAEKTNLTSDQALLMSDQGKKESIELSNQVGEIKSTSRDIFKAAEESTTSSNQVHTKAKEAGEIIVKLSQASSEIAQFTKIISTISSQTNLLALNATIEAARAGDAGKGFAVVASEVKELARQTSQAAEQVEEQIKNILEVVSQVDTSIGEITLVSEKMKAQSDNVYHCVTTQGKATEIIFDLISKSNANLESINTNILTVKSVAESNSASVSQLNSEYRGLFGLSKKLQEVVAQFKKQDLNHKGSIAA